MRLPGNDLMYVFDFLLPDVNDSGVLYTCSEDFGSLTCHSDLDSERPAG